MIIGQLIVDLIPFDIELTSFTANAIFIRIKVSYRTYAKQPYLVGANGRSPLQMVYNWVFCVSPILQTRPDDVVAEIPESKGFSQSPGKQKLAPIWIGYRYQIQKERSPSGESGQRQSAGWWRRRHWRRVAVGKREENLRDWRWIERTWCEPS